VKSTADGDDYAAMYEVLARRFRRGKAAQAASQSGGGASGTPGQAPEVQEIEVPEAELVLAADGEGAFEAESPKADAGEAPLAEGPPNDTGGTPERGASLLDAGEALDPRSPVIDESEAPEGGALFMDAGEAHDAERRASEEQTAPSSGAGVWDLPDLLVVDGGRGQLQVALSAARDLGLHGLPIVGLAKERETRTGEKMVDRVYLPGQKNGIPLRSTSSALFFLARARDEAHRFANHARKRLGKSRRLRSEVEDIPGLGPAVRTALLRELGSLEALRRATDAQILAVSGVTKRHLTALRKVIPAPETT
jgi:excinuclease ABC subunit C